MQCSESESERERENILFRLVLETGVCETSPIDAVGVGQKSNSNKSRSVRFELRDLLCMVLLGTTPCRAGPSCNNCVRPPIVQLQIVVSSKLPR